MRDRNEPAKRLGYYLTEAGLITPAQVDVVLNDQKIMDGMRFGEVLVARGWIKQQTLDYLIKKIVEPEQRAAKAFHRDSPDIDLPPVAVVVKSAFPEVVVKSALPEVVAKSSALPLNERKPLPSLPTDDGVSWAG